MTTESHFTSPQRRLLAASAAALVAVGLTARVDVSPGDRALAAVVVVGGTGALIATRRGVARRWQAWFSWPPALLAAAALLAVAAPMAAAHAIRSDRQETPQLTVRDFLAAAVVDHDGLHAAQYLSPLARISYEGHSPIDPTDAQFFARAHLSLGGLNIQSDAQLKELRYTLLRAGNVPAVWVSHGNQGMLFVLAPASVTDRNEFLAPQTPWRIESGVAALGTTPAS